VKQRFRLACNIVAPAGFAYMDPENRNVLSFLNRSAEKAGRFLILIDS